MSWRVMDRETKFVALQELAAILGGLSAGLALAYFAGPYVPGPAWLRYVVGFLLGWNVLMKPCMAIAHAGTDAHRRVPR